MSQFFPVSILQGLLFHPWVKLKSQELLVSLLQIPGQTELNSLVTILTETDKAGDITGLKDQAKVGILGASGKRLLKNQKLQNRMKDLIPQNKRLMTNMPPASVTYYFLREQSHKIFVSIRTKTNYLAHSRPSVTWMYQGVSCNKLAHMLNGNRNRSYNIGMWNCRI